MEKKSLLAAISTISTVVFIFLVFSLCNSPKEPDDSWQAPKRADNLKNPFPKSLTMEQEGQELYNLYCQSCHGQTGLGDGAAGREAGGPPPANLQRRRVQNQTDGALFWKLNTGKGQMPAFEKILTEEQRWHLVAFMRKLPDLVPPITPPIVLHPEIKAEHVMSIGPLAVRILQHPITGDLWYTTFDGDVFQIKNLNSGKPLAEKVFSVQDHGIAVLQGADFLKNSLFLCGNVYSTNKENTKGRMVRYDLGDSGKHSMTTVFNTVAYGANKTIYDHGWNALSISPDGKYIYVNSGARTDHGEVQDNGGLYPNARDNALTSKIFRFPIDAKDLELPDDESKLKTDGYLFAEGIRNAYDLAFDGTGNLFGVSNSADYDYPEDMFWIRQHHHYGFPWIMGGIENPQQYKDWEPDPDKNAFINKMSHSWETKYYYKDTSFPELPDTLKISPGVQNLGPDANEYRGHTGKVLDGDRTGVTISTFTPHCCPLGLCFDTKKILSGDLKGDGFVIRYTSGAGSSLMQPFTNEGADVLHLEFTYDAATDNYVVKSRRIITGFREPVDAILVDNIMYLIEYGGKGGNIWKIILPMDSKQQQKKTTKKKKAS